MVLGWRRAFCTSVPKDEEDKDKHDSKLLSLKIGSRFGGIFSNPSTSRPASSAPQSPKLRCKTRDTSGASQHHSTPASPRSPSALSFLRSSLRLSKNRCEICLESLKTGQGTAIFTAECRHSFHFPCVAAQVRNQCSLTCPVCNSPWKEIQLHSVAPATQTDYHELKKIRDDKNVKRLNLKVYNDDEPLSTPSCGASNFNPIPESDENDDKLDEFPGFFVNDDAKKARNFELGLLSETAMISVGKTSETYAVVLKVKAPPVTANRRAPIDLVTVLNVSRSVTSEKLYLMKKSMRQVVSSLSAADRLSIVAFSAASKRLLPLRRMTSAGKRAARRIIDAVIPLDDTAASAVDSLKKAVKVIEDRREKNPASCIMLFSDGHRGGAALSQTLFSDIPLHSVNLNAAASGIYSLGECIITNLLSVVIQDLIIQLNFRAAVAGSAVSAVYSAHGGRPTFLGSGSNWCKLGDLYSGEERQVLVELKVGTHYRHLSLSVRYQYKDPSTQELLLDNEQELLVPRPRAVGSSSAREIQRLRCLFVTTRALAESRRLADRNDIAGAHDMLTSARDLILQSGSGAEFVRGLEAELLELNWKRYDEPRIVIEEYKAEPFTPTSAWRAAERLAKVAIMKKSLNRVSDLHGFENARF